MIKTLEELRAENHPKATWESVEIKIGGKDRAIAEKIFQKYFADFICFLL